jgi:pimeloyl-ACP methyl ester carboxylesterase
MDLVTPLGVGVETAWSRLPASHSGLRRLPDEIVGDLPAKVGGVVPRLDEDELGGLDLDLMLHSVRPADAQPGFYTFRCDPAVAKAFGTPWFYPALDLWKYWELVKILILVLRGTNSDLLSRDLALEMRGRNRRAAIFQFDDCGHVPPLMTVDQISVQNF